MAEKFLPADMSEGIERFLTHLCKSEAVRDGHSFLAWEQYRSRYEIEIRNKLAHIWESRHGRRSVAWVVLGDDLLQSETGGNGERKKGAWFKRGDILKSATWKAPAKNFARGNVLDAAENFARWTWAGWI